jgi:hypothetical protein
MCIRRENCGEPSYPDGEAFNGGSQSAVERIQTSGIECTSFMNPDLERGYFGIRNNSAENYGSVFCPIVPSADDTNEQQNRRVKVFVNYKSPSPEIVPVCQLAWRSRTPQSPVGEEHWSLAFTEVRDVSDLLESSYLDVGIDVALTVSCDVPPLTTIQGMITEMSVSAVADGI